MKTIRVPIPVYASIMHKLELPATWGRMTPAEKAEYALDHAERTSGLCHQCADTFETDGEVVDDAEEWLAKYFFK